jgi:hypothetical protein
MTKLIAAGNNGAGGARMARLEDTAVWDELLVGEGTTLWRFRELLQGGLPVHHVIDAVDSSLYRLGGQLWRSVLNDPLHWEKVTGLQLYVQDITVDDEGNYWAITSDAADANPVSTTLGSRIWKGTNNGAVWTQKFLLGQDGFGVIAGRKPQAWNIAVNPTDPDIIIVHGSETTTSGTRFWRSTDGGETWTGINPGLGTNSVGGRVRAFGYNAAGVLSISQNNNANTEARFYDSANNGTTWTQRFVFTTGNTVHQQMLFGAEGFDWWLTEERLYRVSADHLTFTLAAQSSVDFLSAELTAINVEDGFVYLGIDCASCSTIHSIYKRPVDLSTAWELHADTMVTDLGYLLRVNTQGLLGATDYTVITPPDEEPPPHCLGMLDWEVLIGGQAGYYSRSRAFGMGLNNAGGDQTAFLADAETTWNPSGGGCFGAEHGPYHVRREIIVNDYGINKGSELKNLAGSYLPSKEKSLGGFTVIKFREGGILRATATAPHPYKPLQAGDEIQLGGTCEGPCGIDGGTWVVDEVVYEFPQGISTITISRRPASQTGTYPQGNVRSLGESIAEEGQVFESEWFHPLDPAFKSNTINQDEAGVYDTFKFEHYMGQLPSDIIMVASKRKIFNWFDDAEVAEGSPLYVPKVGLFDHTQVQGVGFDVIRLDEQLIVFQFRRFLFYSDIEGKWVFPTERFIKMWLIP